MTFSPTPTDLLRLLIDQGQAASSAGFIACAEGEALLQPAHDAPEHAAERLPASNANRLNIFPNFPSVGVTGSAPPPCGTQTGDARAPDADCLSRHRGLALVVGVCPPARPTAFRSVALSHATEHEAERCVRAWWRRFCLWRSDRHLKSAGRYMDAAAFWQRWA